VSEVNTLLDVAFQALDASLKQSLLIFVDACKHINGLLGTVGPKFNGHGEEVAASLLGNWLATWNAWQVHKAGLNKAFLALHSSDDLLGKAEASICHRESGGTCTILGLDNLITTELYALN